MKQIQITYTNEDIENRLADLRRLLDQITEGATHVTISWRQNSRNTETLTVYVNG